MTSTYRQALYGMLAVLGLVGPWYHNIRFLRAHENADLAAFVAGGFANPAAASLSVDILVAGTAYCVFLVVEGRRLGMRHLWAYLALVPTVAFACSFPLFLMMRERHLASAAGDER